MSFSTDWDVNQYRADYESEEHWELRKAFIEAHKDKFPENELVCLAQVFTNIEFLGCRYPRKTMERVAHLSKDVAAKFRALRSGRLKRTFVGASDAASAKAKGRKSKNCQYTWFETCIFCDLPTFFAFPWIFNGFFVFFSEIFTGRGPQSQTTTKPNNQNTQQKSAFPSLKSSFTKQQEPTADEIESEATSTNSINRKVSHKSDSDSDDGGTFARPSFSMNPSSTTDQKQPDEIEHPAHTTFHSKTLAGSTAQQRRIPDTGFIIYETLSQNDQQQQSINILQVSAAKQGATIKCDVEVGKIHPNTLDCVVRINDTVYGTAPITTGKKEAKVQAFDNALQYARKIHYTIKVNFACSDHDCMQTY